MKRIAFLLVATLFAGCGASVVTTTTTYPMNHFQSGKTVEIDSAKSFQIGIFAGMARTMRATIRRDSAANKSVFYNDTRALSFGGMLQVPLSERFEVGGDVTFSAFSIDDRNFAEEGLGRIGGGTALRVFGKYALLPTSSRIGVALMPVVGYALGGVGESSDLRINQNEPAKATASSGGLTLEFAAPISFHASKDFALALTPVYYALNQNVRYVFTPENRGAEEKSAFNRRFSNFGLGVGVRARALRFEVTFVENLRGAIIPFFGLMLAL